MEPLETNFSEILIEIYVFSFKKMHLKMSSGKWRPFCLGLSVLSQFALYQPANSIIKHSDMLADKKLKAFFTYVCLIIH